MAGRPSYLTTGKQRSVTKREMEGHQIQIRSSQRFLERLSIIRCGAKIGQLIKIVNRILKAREWILWWWAIDLTVWIVWFLKGLSWFRLVGAQLPLVQNRGSHLISHLLCGELYYFKCELFFFALRFALTDVRLFSCCASLQFFACISTVIDVATDRPTPTPFGTQHVALLLAAWGPVVVYGVFHFVFLQYLWTSLSFRSSSVCDAESNTLARAKWLIRILPKNKIFDPHRFEYSKKHKWNITLIFERYIRIGLLLASLIDHDTPGA